MKYLVPIVALLAAQAGGHGAERDAKANTLDRDEAAIAVHIKALHDPSNDVRAAAAKALREIVAKYGNGTSNIRERDAGEARWMEKVKQVKPGMAKAEVQRILPPFPESPENSGSGTGDSHNTSHRLDPHWIVTVQYRNPDKVIEQPELKRLELRFYVTPPPNYTGTWLAWYINGQKSHEIEFKDGKYDGVFTSFYDNDQKLYEQHYTKGVCDGADIGWYRDGKKMYVGRYRNGKQDGQWIHWYPNGQKQHESNYKDGEFDGPYGGWYPNGQMRFEKNYRNGEMHGTEAGWNEQGVLQYKREYKDGKLVN